MSRRDAERFGNPLGASTLESNNKLHDLLMADRKLKVHEQRK